MTVFAHQYRAKYKAKQRRRSIVNSWDRVLELKIKKKDAQRLAKLLPIPHQQRGAAWFRFLNAGEAKRRHAWLFEFLVQVDCTKFAELIDRDVTRTLGKRSDLNQDEREARQKSLRRILLAYSNLDASLGYCQGMNFIAAHILDHVSDETDAFWMFVAILRRTRNLFCDGLKGFFQATELFDELFKQVLPDLFNHFQMERLSSKMFLTAWFHTLFVFGDPAVVARIWDNLLLGGSEVAIRCALAYIILLKDELMQMSIIEMITYLKHPPISNPQKLLNAAFSFNVPDSFQEHFEHLNEEYALSNYFKNICWINPKHIALNNKNVSRGDSL